MENLWALLTYLNYTSIFLFLFYYYFRNNIKLKKLGYPLFLSYSIAKLIKLVAKIERPSINQYIFDYYSFPSIHATFQFLILYFLWKNEKKVFPLYLPLAILIVYSRIALNVHTIWDILGGSILGPLIYIFYEKIENLKETKRQIIHLSVGILLSSFLSKYYIFFPLILLFAVLIYYVMKNNYFEKIAIDLKREEIDWGAINFFIGIFIACFLGYNVYKAVFIFSFADSIPKIFSKNKKEHLILTFIFGFFASLAYLNILKSILIALIISIGEMIGKYIKVDDNLYLPLLITILI